MIIMEDAKYVHQIASSIAFIYTKINTDSTAKLVE